MNGCCYSLNAFSKSIGSHGFFLLYRIYMVYYIDSFTGVGQSLHACDKFPLLMVCIFYVLLGLIC